MWCPCLLHEGGYPLHLWKRFVNLHEKSKPGIQKQKVSSTDWLLFVHHSRRAIAGTLLWSKACPLQEEGISGLTFRVIEYLGTKLAKRAHFYHYSFEFLGTICCFLAMFYWEIFWKDFCDMVVQPNHLRCSYLFCINIGVSNLMGL